MGMDAAGFDSALRNAKESIREFGEHASEHMDRAAMSGRMLHRIIEKISTVSPIAGAAIVGAFSLPMLALEGLMLGLESLKEHFKEVKEKADAASLAINKAFTGSVTEPFDVARSAGKTRAERERSGIAVSDQEFENLKQIEEQRNRLKDAEEKEARARKNFETNTDVQQRDFKKMVWDLALDTLHTEQNMLDALENGDKDRLEANRKLDRMQEEAQRRKQEANRKDAEFMEWYYDKNVAIDKLERERTRVINAPFTSNLGEMAGFNTPYGRLAKELLNAQLQTRIAGSMAGPGEAAGIDNQVSSLRASLRPEAARAWAAGDRNAWIAVNRKYAEGLQAIMGGQMPPNPQLESIRTEIENLNKQKLRVIVSDVEVP